MTAKPILKAQQVAPPDREPSGNQDLSEHVAIIRSTLAEHPWDGPRMQAWLSKAYEKFKPTFGMVGEVPMPLCPPPWHSTRDMPNEAIIALASAMRAAQQ